MAGKTGTATSKAELRARQKEEDRLAVKKMQWIDAEIAPGRRKLLTAKEAMGEKSAKILESYLHHESRKTKRRMK